MKPANLGPFYAAGLYPQLAEVFRAHGYALAVHGSVGTDFDLIAVPWEDSAGAPADVIKECLAKFAFEENPHRGFEPKPHSRCAYKLHLSFGNCSLDISFTPRTGKWWRHDRTITVQDPPEPDFVASEHNTEERVDNSVDSESDSSGQCSHGTSLSQHCPLCAGDKLYENACCKCGKVVMCKEPPKPGVVFFCGYGCT